MFGDPASIHQVLPGHPHMNSQLTGPALSAIRWWGWLCGGCPVHYGGNDHLHMSDTAGSVFFQLDCLELQLHTWRQQCLSYDVSLHSTGSYLSFWPWQWSFTHLKAPPVPETCLLIGPCGGPWDGFVGISLVFITGAKEFLQIMRLWWLETD